MKKLWFRLFFILFLLCSLFYLPLFSISKIKASSILATGSDFSLYFMDGSSLEFQYLTTQGGYPHPWKGKITVSSGVLNGSDGTLTMSYINGRLRFTSQDIAVLVPNENTIISVNGEVRARFSGSASIGIGDLVIISWATPVLEPLLPITFMMGMIGLLAMFVGPMYCVHLYKKKDYYEALRTGLTVTVIGFALFLCWLWA